LVFISIKQKNTNEHIYIVIHFTLEKEKTGGLSI
jgi:hypothetical protein